MSRQPHWYSNLDWEPHSESRASALPKLSQRIRPAGKKLAGWLDCHIPPFLNGPSTLVWQPAILTRPERNMTISRLWVNYQCAELYPGLWTSPQCTVPATPLVFERGLRAPLKVASQRSNQLAQRVRPAGEKLAGWLDCHTCNWCKMPVSSDFNT